MDMGVVSMLRHLIYCIAGKYDISNVKVYIYQTDDCECYGSAPGVDVDVCIKVGCV